MKDFGDETGDMHQQGLRIGLPMHIQVWLYGHDGRNHQYEF